MDITWIGYYLCIAFALGLSTAFTMLREANIIARELTTEMTNVDRYPIFSYICWSVAITVAFPWVLVSFVKKDYDEMVCNIAVGLSEKAE